MTKQQLMSYVAAVLTTALETEPSPFPESMAYLAMGADLGKWETVKQALTFASLITCEGHDIQLTTKGREVAKQCAEVLAK
jgi:hypothetical protein